MEGFASMRRRLHAAAHTVLFARTTAPGGSYVKEQKERFELRGLAPSRLIPKRRGPKTFNAEQR